MSVRSDSGPAPPNPSMESALARIAEGLERLAPPQNPAPDWRSTAVAAWQEDRGFFPLSPGERIELDDLVGIERQRAQLENNTQRFLRGMPANHALMWGARGTGKSSLVRALLHRYLASGLRVIEVDKTQLAQLPQLIELIRRAPFRFVLFCDDLSFEAGEGNYKHLKSVLDGSLASGGENHLIYATSNRRHLMPESMQENLEAEVRGGEIHAGDTTEEKISLSDRFGLWLSFHPFSQERYLEAAACWVERLAARHGGDGRFDAARREAALLWSRTRGNRSGRTAYQFARDCVGRSLLELAPPSTE